MMAYDHILDPTDTSIVLRQLIQVCLCGGLYVRKGWGQCVCKVWHDWRHTSSHIHAIWLFIHLAIYMSKTTCVCIRVIPRIF